jgi:feruloyl esterase
MTFLNRRENMTKPMDRRITRWVSCVVFAMTAAALAALVTRGPVVSAAGMACNALSDLKLQDTTITMAEAVAAGTFTPPRTQAAISVPFCRVTGTIKPTSDSDIKFELWLPQTSAWSGRYQTVGNGGFAGNIRYDLMVGPLLGGTAVASTDDGHSATATPGATWALNHPEKIADYAYRAVHVTTETSKAVTAAFYGSPARHSYFYGCSKGGGEGHMEAQRYPMDFDGIVVSAPANRFVEVFIQFAYGAAANLASRDGYLSADDIAKIGAKIIEACDAQDGVRDGVINNPLTCHPNLDSLGLTAAQLKTYKMLHEGPQINGKQYFPGEPYGVELVGWNTNVAGPSFDETASRAAYATFGGGFLTNMVYNDPSWDFRRFDLAKASADAQKAVGKVLNADDLHYAGFRQRNGKLLEVNGWADVQVPVLGSIDWYEKVIAAQAGASRGKAAGKQASEDAAALAQTREWYRMFVAPGVGHCGGGPGPNRFGQGGGNGDAEHDAVVAMYQWVEKGKAPSQLIGTKYVDNDRNKAVQLTRPLCMYPMMAKYKGTGDTNDARNFVCAIE